MRWDAMKKNISVINIGPEIFLPALQATGSPFTNLAWKPPAQGDTELIDILFALSVRFRDASGNSLIQTANEEALRRIVTGSPVLRRVRPAHECIPALNKTTILHAGPPIHWKDMCGPMQGAILGALQYEKLADSAAEAEALMESGSIFYGPTYPHGAVAPMAGIISYSMPLLVVENETYGNQAYAPLNEGSGQVLRFGANAPAVLARLRWMEESLAVVLDAALHKAGGVNLKSIMAQALSMGDEMHQRNIAASLLFYKSLCCELEQSARDRKEAQQILEFMVRENDQFFLNIAMAACRSMMDPARGIPYSSVITAMSRNGVQFGITISALGDRWFTAPSQQLHALYFPGFSEDDACLDMGDSAIIESCGLGGCAMGAAPAVARLLNRADNPPNILAHSSDMSRICVGANPDFPLPHRDFAGIPTAMDLCRIVATRTLPVITSGVAHKRGGVGQVGTGFVTPPIEVMRAALRYFYSQLLTQSKFAP